MDINKLKLLIAEGEGLTVEFKEKYSSKIDRDIIADIFQQMVEKVGSGIGRMRKLIRMAGLKEPVFESDSFFRVIFYRDVRYALKTTQKSSQKSSQKIIELIRGNSGITIEELAVELHLTGRSIKKNLAALKNSGKLCRIGPDKGGHWEVLTK